MKNLKIKKVIMLMTASILITTTAFAQKGYYLQFAIQPGSTSITSDWNTKYDNSNYVFEKLFSISLEAGLNGG